MPKDYPDKGLGSLVKGRANYKGRQYYILFEGETRRGYGLKLCYLDGSRSFWAEPSLATVTKRFRKAVTIQYLNEYRKAAQEGTLCTNCGKPGANVNDLEDGLLKHSWCCDIPPDIFGGA